MLVFLYGKRNGKAVDDPGMGKTFIPELLMNVFLAEKFIKTIVAAHFEP